MYWTLRLGGSRTRLGTLSIAWTQEFLRCHGRVAWCKPKEEVERFVSCNNLRRASCGHSPHRQRHATIGLSLVGTAPKTRPK